MATSGAIANLPQLTSTKRDTVQEAPLVTSLYPTIFFPIQIHFQNSDFSLNFMNFLWKLIWEEGFCWRERDTLWGTRYGYRRNIGDFLFIRGELSSQEGFAASRRRVQVNTSWRGKSSSRQGTPTTTKAPLLHSKTHGACVNSKINQVRQKSISKLYFCFETHFSVNFQFPVFRDNLHCFEGKFVK